VVCRYVKRLKLMVTSQPNYAGWSSSARLAWHHMLPCIACATCCFSVCLYGDHEATSGECFLYILSLVIVAIIHCNGLTCDLLSATEWWPITEEHTAHFEISSIYDWLVLFVSAVRIVYLLVCASVSFIASYKDHEFTTPSLFTEFYSQIINQIHDYFVLTPCFPLGLQTMSSAQPSKFGYGKWVEQSL